MESAMQLNLFVHNQPQPRLDALDPGTIDAIASLLEFEDTRIWSAWTLARIGSAAKRSVPALERALREEEAIPPLGLQTGVSVVDALRQALASIRAEPASLAPLD